MLKISVTEVYCSAMFIIQWNLHSPLPFLLNLAGTHDHIRQVGRAALPVIVHPSAYCVVGWTTLSASRPGPLGDGDSGDCDPYWPAENGQVATTQSADGCTYQATAELEYGADVTAPTLTGPVPGPLWPVYSLTVHPSSLPICGRSAGV